MPLSSKYGGEKDESVGWLGAAMVCDYKGAAA